MLITDVRLIENSLHVFIFVNRINSKNNMSCWYCSQCSQCSKCWLNVLRLRRTCAHVTWTSHLVTWFPLWRHCANRTESSSRTSVPFKSCARSPTCWRRVSTRWKLSTRNCWRERSASGPRFEVKSPHHHHLKCKWNLEAYVRVCFHVVFSS